MILVRLLLTLVASCSLLSVEARSSEAFLSRKTTSQRIAVDNSVTRCHLFFRTTNPAELAKPTKACTMPPQVFQELSSAQIKLPYTFQMGSEGSSELCPVVSVRLLKTRDLQAITDMCVEEYGSPSSLEILLKDLSQRSLSDYLDGLALRALVDLTMRLKITDDTTSKIPEDHAILVAIQDEHIVGMVEVSRQPPFADRNPPPFPIPLWMKQLYCTCVGAQEPQGWCANLLIKPDYRGKGYSKVLMAGVEGVVRSWKCESVHLHADADSISGMVPQRLYETLGYEMLRDDKQDLSWMGPVNLSSSVFVIDGVPLLYLVKTL